jgi:hypothetical protein
LVCLCNGNSISFFWEHIKSPSFTIKAKNVLNKLYIHLLI